MHRYHYQKVNRRTQNTTTDSLVKAAAWTHNTLVNKLGYSPLQLVTGQAVMIPGLTTGNEATESMTDSEAVQRTMENLMRITSEFRESDMRKKLKDCQSLRVRDYNIGEVMLKVTRFGFSHSMGMHGLDMHYY